MTRVNVIDPTVLLNQHLMAEIREMPMVTASLKRSLLSKNGVDWKKLPESYTLNKGHVKFFYNKGAWLEKRWHLIIDEALARGWNVDRSRMDFSVWRENDAMNDYTVHANDIRINLERIVQRVYEKPTFYVYTGSSDFTVQQIVEGYESALKCLTDTVQPRTM